MKTNKLDQFYTNPKVSDELLTILFDMFYSIRKDPNSYTFIEPSAGTGNFIDSLFKLNVDVKKQVIAYDLEPKINDLIKQGDFFDINFSNFKLNKKRTITIGNPPFGKNGKLALEFLNKSLEHSGIVAFILPKTFNRYSIQSKVREDAKLIFNKSLDQNSFIVNDREYNVNCCFQIWVRPEIVVSITDLRLKKQIKSLTDDVQLFIHNNTKETLKFFNKKKYKWDFAVHRQGYYDYNKFIKNEKDLKINQQYLFIKCKNKEILKFIKEINFEDLAKKNSTTVLGFSNSDFYEALYEKIIYSKFNDDFFN